MGAVVLAITGAEALYADMGHFGRAPIARAWFWLVFPALTLCYMGQGALLLAQPGSIANPFILLFPEATRFSIRAAGHPGDLNCFPIGYFGCFLADTPSRPARFPAENAGPPHFSPRSRPDLPAVRKPGSFHRGKPAGFRVWLIRKTGQCLWHGRQRYAGHRYDFIPGCHAQLMGKSARYAVLAAGVSFCRSICCSLRPTCPKYGTAAGFPIGLALSFFLIITTWTKGQRIISGERKILEGPLQAFVDKIRSTKPPLKRIPGTAVYISHHAERAPLALHATVEELHELSEKVVLVTVKITDSAHIPEDERAVFDNLRYKDDGISHLTLSYGFHDSPNVPKTLETLRHTSPELDFDPEDSAYFISLSKVVRTDRRNLSGWRKSLYSLMARNALSVTDYYKLPVERTVEMRSLD